MGTSSQLRIRSSITHTHKKSVISQREIGNDVQSFSGAIRSALRQDPDVMLVGEMRDLETMEAAISAAETGHLVFATLHTTGSARTVDRIVDAFPSGAKDQIRTQLASSIVAVISQVLCKKLGGGRVAAFEIMVNTNAIAQMIREKQDVSNHLGYPDRFEAWYDHTRFTFAQSI